MFVVYYIISNYVCLLFICIYLFFKVLFNIYLVSTFKLFFAVYSFRISPRIIQKKILIHISICELQAESLSLTS